jgi:hypothetical protein
MRSGLPKQRGGSVLDHDGASVICSSRDAARPRLRAIAAPRAPGVAGAGNGFNVGGREVRRAPTIGKNYLADTEALIFDKYRPCLQPAHMHGDCNVKRNTISVFK